MRLAAADAGARRGVVLDVPATLAQRFAVRSRMAMALYPKGVAPYLFGMHQCSGERAWTADEQRLFEEIGHRLTDALSSHIAFRGLRESERRLEAALAAGAGGLVGARLWHGSRNAFGRRVPDLRRAAGRPSPLNLVHPEDREREAAASEIALHGGPLATCSR
jgi:GAF domain-containing protein